MHVMSLTKSEYSPTEVFTQIMSHITAVTQCSGCRFVSCDYQQLVDGGTFQRNLQLLSYYFMGRKTATVFVTVLPRPLYQIAHPRKQGK
jgi:hypothetical protein